MHLCHSHARTQTHKSQEAYVMTDRFSQGAGFCFRPMKLNFSVMHVWILQVHHRSSESHITWPTTIAISGMSTVAWYT